MINRIIAYDIAELEKTKVLSQAKVLYKSKVLNEEQWNTIREKYASKLYSPSVFMKVVLFIFSLIGMTTVIGPIAALFGDIGKSGYQILAFILGILILFFTERVLIKQKSHFNSGITEAGIFSGLSFIAFGLLSLDPPGLYLSLFVGLILTLFAAIRYLNLFALVLAIGFFCGIIFRVITDIGGFVEALMPFIFMTLFGILYWFTKKLQAKLPNVIFENQFIVLKTLALTLFYISGNYFVVRKLSFELMGLNISPNDDIPFALVFYILTALVPIGYLYWGIKRKSILLIRVGLLTIALSALTFRYYFSLGHPVLIITVSGALLILIALVIFNYLKQIRNGYTRELLLHEKWSSQNLTAIIASQTLGGNKINDPTDDAAMFNGGSFGGAGAGGNW